MFINMNPPLDDIVLLLTGFEVSVRYSVRACVQCVDGDASLLVCM